MTGDAVFMSVLLHHLPVLVYLDGSVLALSARTVCFFLFLLLPCLLVHFSSLATKLRRDFFRLFMVRVFSGVVFRVMGKRLGVELL